MPTFDDVAFQSDYPVIHAQREDGATLIATRIPLDDVRLERWGWILTLSHKDGSIGQDDIETLQDNAGRRYPKVHLLADVYSYIEKWNCHEWEVGYQKNSDTTASVKIGTPLNADLLREDVLQEISNVLRVEVLEEGIHEQLLQVQEKICETIEVQSSRIREDAIMPLETLKEAVQADLTPMKDIEDYVRKIWETVDPSIDTNSRSNRRS